jgi:LPXTG-motif cell wall-anchored protein
VTVGDAADGGDRGNGNQTGNGNPTDDDEEEDSDPTPCPFDETLDLDDEACVDIGAPQGPITSGTSDEVDQPEQDPSSEDEIPTVVLGNVILPGGSETLPQTGSDTRSPALVGAGLVALGASMVVATRRRQAVG